MFGIVVAQQGAGGLDLRVVGLQVMQNVLVIMRAVDVRKIERVIGERGDCRAPFAGE